MKPSEIIAADHWVDRDLELEDGVVTDILILMRTVKPTHQPGVSTFSYRITDSTDGIMMRGMLHEALSNMDREQG